MGKWEEAGMWLRLGTTGCRGQVFWIPRTVPGHVPMGLFLVPRSLYVSITPVLGLTGVNVNTGKWIRKGKNQEKRED